MYGTRSRIDVHAYTDCTTVNIVNKKLNRYFTNFK